MLKKWTLSLLASVMLAIPVLSASSLASPAAVELDNGKLQNNRVLIPLRDVSQHLGAQVEWDKRNQLITIVKDDTTIELVLGSKKVQVNQSEVTLDVPAQIMNGGTTYVPLRFVSQTLGADVKWDQRVRQATITLNDLQIAVNMNPGQPPASQKITMERLRQLSDMLNEANDVSAIQQVRSYFAPYFTDRFINSIIRDKGLNSKYEFKDLTSPAYYTSPTTGKFSQSIDIGKNQNGDLVTMTRQAQFVYSEGIWKVDSISFKKNEIPITGA